MMTGNGHTISQDPYVTYLSQDPVTDLGRLPAINEGAELTPLNNADTRVALRK